MFIWMLDVALGTEKRKGLRERQSREELAGRLEGGWRSRCSRGRVLGFLALELGPQGGCTGNEKARRLTALVCIAGAEEVCVVVRV